MVTASARLADQGHSALAWVSDPEHGGTHDKRRQHVERRRIERGRSKTDASPRRGARVLGIVLFPLGGLGEFQRSSQRTGHDDRATPSDELAVAIADPLASLAVACPFLRQAYCPEHMGRSPTGDLVTFGSVRPCVDPSASSVRWMTIKLM